MILCWKREFIIVEKGNVNFFEDIIDGLKDKIKEESAECRKEVPK